jgi:hypothetical protein
MQTVALYALVGVISASSMSAMLSHLVARSGDWPQHFTSLAAAGVPLCRFRPKCQIMPFASKYILP